MKRQQIRGGIFAAKPTAIYHPQGELLGQEQADSCVAACCRMLLFDYAPHLRKERWYSESSLRSELETTAQGSTIALAVRVLQSGGIKHSYHYRCDVTPEQLSEATQFHPAIAIVHTSGYLGAHAIIIDGMDAVKVLIRDPLPERIGSAYALSLSEFLPVWLNPQTGCGKAVVVLE